MPVREIKTRFKLEGEQEYRKQMSAAASAIKVLNSEQKLAEAQFRATGDAETYVTEKSRILKEQIEEQKKAVSAAESALKQLADDGYSSNSKEVQTWTTKLNNAKTTLLGLEQRLASVGDETKQESDEFSSASDNAEDLHENMKKVAEGVDFSNTIASIGRITSAIESTVKAAAKAAKAVWDLGADAGKWADDLMTAASEAGVDVETYQSWQYASRFIDTSVDDIKRSWLDLDKYLTLDDQSEEFTLFAEKLRKLGVEAIDPATGKAKEGKDAFWEIIDSLHGMGSETEWAAAAMDIFGKDWRKLNPLISAGGKAYQEMAEEGRTVAVVSEENVNALGGLDDQVQQLNATFDKLKFDSLAALTPTLTKVSEALQTAVQSLNEFVQSEEGQKALAGLNEALSGLIDSFLGEDGGKGTFEAIVSGAKDAVEKFTTAMEWITKNGETVKGIVTGLGVAWAGLKVTSGVLTFMQLLDKIPLDKLTALFGGGSAGAAGSAAGAAAGKAGGTAAAAGLTGKLAGAAAAAAPVALGAGAAAVVGYGIHEGFNAQARTNRDAHDMQAVVMAEDAITTGTNDILAAYEAVEAARQALIEATGNGGITPEKIQEVTESEAFQKAMALLGMQDVDWLSAWQNGGFAALIGGNGYGGLMGDMQDTLYDMAEDAALNVDEGLVDGVNEGLPEVEEAGQGSGDALIQGATDALDEHSPSKVFHGIGENVAVGLAQGIYDRADEAIRAAQWLASEITATVQSALDIHSPSRVMAALGRNTGEGFALGIERSADSVSRAVDRMIAGTMRAPSAAQAGLYAGATGRQLRPASEGGRPDAVHVTMVLDDNVLGDVMAPIVNGKIGAKMASTRRTALEGIRR